MFRNIDANLADVTEAASVAERLYTLGCTAGDWNQDGFPDLITANIGTNHLWINNGDGTFTQSSLGGSDDLERMPASIAMADLNADNLPDIFEGIVCISGIRILLLFLFWHCWAHESYAGFKCGCDCGNEVFS